MKIFHRFLVLIVFCLGGVASASAVPTVTLSGSNGVFVVAASGFQSIGGAKITLNYDTSTLVNPRVSKGELGSRAAVWVANTNLPGRVIIAPATLEGFPESGVIATISFDLIGNPPGVIPSVTAMVNRGDRGRDFAARVVNPFATMQTSSGSKAGTGDTLAADRPDNTDATPGDATTPAGTADRTRTRETTSTTASTVSSSTGAAGIRGIELVAAPAAPSEADPAAVSDGSRNVAAPEGITTASEAAAGETADDATTVDSSAAGPLPVVESLPQPRVGDAAQGREPGQAVYRSVLEAFRSFNGQRTPESLRAIFNAQEATGVRQEPAIALSDGVSRVRLLIALRPAENAPSFSLTDARLVSLKAEPGGKWLLELLPAKGTCQAGVTVIHGGAHTVIPLVVAPPLPPGVGGTVTASRFAQFLGDRGTEKTPRFDLNGDGRRDFIDDYIFTANFLAGKQGEAGKASGEPARKK